MTGFRGTDDALEREIAEVERAARLRVRRTAAELKDLDLELRDLRKERARRRAEDPTREVVANGTEAPAGH